MGGAETQAEGGLRLELLYPPSLLALWTYGTLGWSDGTLRPRWVGTLGVIGAVVAVLLFIVQSRRMMVAAAILTALAILVSARRRTARALVSKLGAVAAALVIFTLASSGWRSVAPEEMLSLADRVERAFEAVSDPTGLEHFESRLTYLWFDGMTHELRTTQNAEIDGGALLLSAVVTAVPRSLLSAKSEFEQVSCERGLEGFSGMDVDLPCTPTGEGFLMAGFLGVLLAGLLWGLTLGAVEACVERGPGLARVFGLFVFYQFVLVETGVFASVAALRLGLLGTAFVWAIAVLVRVGTGLRHELPRSL
jgi:hypothetical protein